MEEEERDKVLQTENEILHDEEVGDIELTPEMLEELQNQKGDEE